MTQSPYDFQPLLDEFADTRDAIHSESPRQFDPLDFARCGFALTASDTLWAIEHERFINERCNGELSNESLADHGPAVPAWRAFSCLALGYLLGLYQTERIVGLQFEAADAQLAGFMYLHSPKFENF